MHLKISSAKCWSFWQVYIWRGQVTHTCVGNQYIPSLVLKIAFRLSGAKPLSNLVLAYWLKPAGQISMKFESRDDKFHSRKSVWRCHQQNGRHFVSGIVFDCVCVCVSITCSLVACPRDNSRLVQARITKFGPKMQNTLVLGPYCIRTQSTLTFKVKSNLKIKLYRILSLSAP